MGRSGGVVSGHLLGHFVDDPGIVFLGIANGTVAVRAAVVEGGVGEHLDPGTPTPGVAVALATDAVVGHDGTEVGLGVAPAKVVRRGGTAARRGTVVMTSQVVPNLVTEGVVARHAVGPRHGEHEVGAGSDVAQAAVLRVLDDEGDDVGPVLRAEGVDLVHDAIGIRSGRAVPQGGQGIVEGISGSLSVGGVGRVDQAELGVDSTCGVGVVGFGDGQGDGVFHPCGAALGIAGVRRVQHQNVHGVIGWCGLEVALIEG